MKVTFGLLGFLMALSGCTPSHPSIQSVSPRETAGLLRNDFAVLVDVREEDELKKEGMAAPAQWIATSHIRANDEVWKAFVEKLPHDKQIIFYCAVGGRAGKAAEELAALGYRTGNMGGFRDWKSAGLPVSGFPKRY
jgi:rhodanese-related sulfurtransferase